MFTSFTHEPVPFDQDAHNHLVHYVRTAHLTRDWVSQYLDLGKELLEGTGLVNSDKRLVTTTPRDRRRFMPIIINARWVIIGYDHWDTVEFTPSVAIIYGYSLWQKRRKQNLVRVFYEGGFQQCIHEEATGKQSPFFLNLNTIDDVTELIKQDWIQTARDELENASGSLQRQYHNPTVYKFITHLDYREQVLDEAFSSMSSESFIGPVGKASRPEGRAAIGVHRRYERNQSLVQAKKALVLQQTGELRCEVCGFNFSEQYGEWGDGYIECHHKVPLSAYNEQQCTSLDDLALVCANCHRMFHHSHTWVSVEQLQEIIQKNRKEPLPSLSHSL